MAITYFSDAFVFTILSAVLEDSGKLKIALASSIGDQFLVGVMQEVALSSQVYRILHEMRGADAHNPVLLVKCSVELELNEIFLSSLSLC